MMQVFDARHMIVARGRVYNRHTGRFLGNRAEFGDAVSAAPVAEDTTGRPFVGDLTKKDLVEIAKKVNLPGYSTLTKDELAASLVEIGAVHDVAPGETDGEDQAGEDEAEPSA